MTLGPRLNLPPQETPASGVGGPVPKGGKVPVKVECRVGIQAPPAIIWEILADLSGWPRWSGIYTRVEGSLRIGARVDLTLAVPGEAHQAFSVNIIDWVPEEQILWRNLRWGGWVASVRFIEIEELAPNACILSNGEQFAGMVGDFFYNRNRRPLRRAYALFADNVKAQAEALWAIRKAEEAKPKKVAAKKPAPK